MKIFYSIDEVGDLLKGGALAIGNFDGMHLGHQALIQKIKTLSKNCAGVLTFSPHPAIILDRNQKHYSLMTDQEKIDVLKECGIDVVILQKIDENFLRISAEDFIRHIIVDKLKIKHVVVGDDFAFGQKARGDVGMLKQSSSLGFITHVVPPIMIGKERCSSTAIRKLLRQSKLAEARAMQGRNFSMTGVVTRGQQQGRALGFPTANIIPDKVFPLALGIYASVTRVDEEDFLSATSVGTRPTVTEDKTVVIETYLLDQTLNLYDQTIRIFFIEKLRSEKKFSSLEELKKHIAEDCARVRMLHKTNPALFQMKD